MQILRHIGAFAGSEQMFGSMNVRSSEILWPAFKQQSDQINYTIHALHSFIKSAPATDVSFDESNTFDEQIARALRMPAGDTHTITVMHSLLRNGSPDKAATADNANVFIYGRPPEVLSGCNGRKEYLLSSIGKTCRCLNPQASPQRHRHLGLGKGSVDGAVFRGL